MGWVASPLTLQRSLTEPGARLEASKPRNSLSPRPKALQLTDAQAQPCPAFRVGVGARTLVLTLKQQEL